MATSMGDLEPRQRRRLIAVVTLRATLSTAVLVVLYYTLPLGEGWRLSVGARVVVAIAVLAGVLYVQIKGIVRSRRPTIRALGAIATTLPLFLLLFATTYFVLSTDSSGSFTQAHLSRTDALYFTVTIFATVGFGDISPASETARVVVMVQMILDLLILGIGVNAFVNAARTGRQRRSTGDDVGEVPS